MINFPKGFQPQKQSGAGFEKLPAGTYVAKILGAKSDNTGYQGAPQLLVQVDICEGEHKDYYQQAYAAAKSGNYAENAKYKGVIKVNLPVDGEPGDQYTRHVKQLQGFVWALSDSNDGYDWNGEEKNLKGKLIGINVRNASYNGNAYTEIAWAESAKEVREGKVKTAKDRKPRGDADDSAFTDVTAQAEEELPF